MTVMKGVLFPTLRQQTFKQYMAYFFSQQNAGLNSLMVKTGDYQNIGLLKLWFKTSERP